MLVGTLGYVSPEQLIGESPATSRDLWALAVVAYETIAGRDARSGIGSAAGKETTDINEYPSGSSGPRAVDRSHGPDLGHAPQ